LCIFSDLAETRKNEEIVELVFNECKKENVNYRMVALKTLGELLEKLKIDRFAQTYQLVMHIIQKVRYFLILICHDNKNSDLQYTFCIYRVPKIQMLKINHNN